MTSTQPRWNWKGCLEMAGEKTPEKRAIRLIRSLMPDPDPSDRPVRIIHVCGTHEQTITKHGIRTLLPDNLEVLSGPGCPVCVTPAEDIDRVIALAESGITVLTYGDMLRVPGSRASLADVRAEGADVRTVYSVNDAVRIAEQGAGVVEVVFFGIGFETTAPSNAAVLMNDPPPNFSILCSHRLIPPAMDALIDDRLKIDGFIAPGHVSTIIGTHPYDRFAEMGYPIVVTGFEPIDVLFSIIMILKQIHDGRSSVENEYARAVNESGNTKAQEMIDRVFEVADVNWRGIGQIRDSGLAIRSEFGDYDARLRYDIAIDPPVDLHPGCSCSLILRALKTPDECELFGGVCTPQTPYGPCMVSTEGTCHNWFRYGGRSEL